VSILEEILYPFLEIACILWHITSAYWKFLSIRIK